MSSTLTPATELAAFTPDVASTADAAPTAEGVCHNCAEPLAGRHCSACGQRHIEGRLTVKRLAAEFTEQFLAFDRGLWYTVARMCVNPGALVRSYLAGQRKRYVGPVAYLFFGAALVLLVFKLGAQEDVAQIQKHASQIATGKHPLFSPTQVAEYERLLLLTRQDQATPSLIMAIPFALLVCWLFRKTRINVAESAVLTLYAFGHFLLVYSLLHPLLVLVGTAATRGVVSQVLFPAAVLHMALTYFGGHVGTALKALVAYGVSMLSVGLLVMAYILVFVR
jgi:hypothetical protein